MLALLCFFLVAADTVAVTAATAAAVTAIYLACAISATVPGMLDCLVEGLIG